jgi:hypothetical protein
MDVFVGCAYYRRRLLRCRNDGSHLRLGYTPAVITYLGGSLQMRVIGTASTTLYELAVGITRERGLDARKAKERCGRA